MRRVDQAHFTFVWGAVIFVAVSLPIISFIGVGSINRVFAGIVVGLLGIASLAVPSLIYPYFYTEEEYPRPRTVRLCAQRDKIIAQIGKVFCSMGAHRWHETYDTRLRMTIKKCHGCKRLKSPVASK